MTTDHWTERLSEYMDGELTTHEAAALEAHLRDCAECARTLHELRAVVTRAARAIDRAPDVDLWQGVAARIAESKLQAAAPPAQMPARRVSFSLPQLAAASVALMLLSAGSVYLVTRQQAARLAAAPDAVETAGSPANRAAITTDKAVARPVTVKSPAAENYDVAIKDLESALQTGRAQLDTSTVRVLETNLRAIDSAIAEARAALGRDPGNPYLNRYLDQTMQRKIQLLRRAAGILRAQT